MNKCMVAETLHCNVKIKTKVYGANKDNFMKNTYAEFMIMARPKREPDFVYKKAKYWITEDGVYRRSKTWGQIDTCFWYVRDYFIVKKNVTAYCRWDEFERTEVKLKKQKVKVAFIKNKKVLMQGNKPYFKEIK